MRILFAFPEPLPMERARSFQALRTAVALAESGVHVVLMHDLGEADPFEHYRLPCPVNLAAVTVSRSLPWPLSRSTSNALFFRRAVATMNVLGAFDAVFTRHLKFAARFIAKGIRMPLIYEAHEVFSDTAPPGKRAERAREELSVVKNAAAIVANSGATAARLLALFGEAKRIEIIPNGVDRAASCPVKDWTDARHRIVYSGSLFPWKGVDDLIAAGKWLSGYKVQVIGGEQDRVEELRASVPDEGADFEFSGRLPQSSVMKHLANQCIAVLPNRDVPDSAFTSPIKLFEYLASGCAIVASDLPSIRELVGNEDVQWASPGNPESLANAIIAIASDIPRAAAMGARFYELSARYTWQERGRRVKSVLSNVTGNFR